MSFTFATRSITAKESYFISAPLPWPGRGARIDVAKAEAAIVGTDREAVRLMARRALRIPGPGSRGVTEIGVVGRGAQGGRPPSRPEGGGSRTSSR
jgi:hypothetical protein